MGYESSDVVRFDFGSILQGQTMVHWLIRWIHFALVLNVLGLVNTEETATEEKSYSQHPLSSMVQFASYIGLFIYYC